MIVGVEARGKFYELTGALRDMVPNHLFQLVAPTAREAPSAGDAAQIRRNKAELVVKIYPVKPAHAVRGQYPEVAKP